jgi:flagellar protein FliL
MIDLDDIDMDASEEDGEASAKPPLLKTLGLSLAVALGLGAVAAGVAFIVPVAGDKVTGDKCDAPVVVENLHEKQTKHYQEIAFVNLEPLIITLGPNAKSRYLKISISLETSEDDLSTVEHLEPKFRDVLNTYLRAVEEADLVEPSATTRLRAQILRRLQVVAPAGAVANVLITDFILS